MPTCGVVHDWKIAALEDCSRRPPKTLGIAGNENAPSLVSLSARSSGFCFCRVISRPPLPFTETSWPTDAAFKTASPMDDVASCNFEESDLCCSNCAASCFALSEGESSSVLSPTKSAPTVANSASTSSTRASAVPKSMPSGNSPAAPAMSPSKPAASEATLTLRATERLGALLVKLPPPPVLPACAAIMMLVSMFVDPFTDSGVGSLRGFAVRIVLNSAIVSDSLAPSETELCATALTAAMVAKGSPPAAMSDKMPNFKLSLGFSVGITTVNSLSALLTDPSMSRASARTVLVPSWPMSRFENSSANVHVLKETQASSAGNFEDPNCHEKRCDNGRSSSIQESDDSKKRVVDTLPVSG
mmetsp:Transcript_30893/g.102888  ORF Transcript_30893/g.102888 Transcript_30893/m.102888 type:complete len:359 (+) Transcript_30893:2422-3498(+)